MTEGTIQRLPGGPGEGVEVVLRGDLATEEMVLNIGPQHPSTHGVLRVVITLDGERIVEAEPVIGYMHRGFEKLAEVRDYHQIIVLVNRHDWLSAFCNEIGVAMAVERLMGLEVPERAQWLRVLLAEWNRVLNHLVFIGSFGLELGAMTPIFYAFREREVIQEFFEMATGGRLHVHFNRVGGLKEDLPKGFMKKSEQALRLVRSRLADYEDLLLGSEIFQARTRGIGVIPPELAKEYGVTGPILQASGVPEDARKTSPYLVYEKLEFDVPVGKTGDAWERFWVLLERVRQSLRIIEQVHEGLPSGPVRARVPKTIKAPEGEIYVRTENPLGQLGYYLVSRGGQQPWRLKMRTASFSNVSILPAILKGALIPDLVAIMGSIFFVVGDVDR